MMPLRDITFVRLFGLSMILAPFTPVAAQSQNLDALPPVRIDQKLGAQTPQDLALFDEFGQSITLGALIDDRPAVLALVYYKCPMLCGEVLNGLLEALQQVTLNVGRDFNVLTVSFDPAETPALALSKKKKYLARYERRDAERGWRFLTGDADAVQALADAVGFRYAYDPATQQYAHAAGIMILTPDGRVARYLYGIDYAPRDLRLGLVEASAGTIGTAVDQFLLLCYHYDPTRGRYGLAIMSTLRLAGGLTVAGLVSLVAVLLRRERARPRFAGGVTESGDGSDVQEGRR